MTKILILNDGRDSSNWGLQATSQALIDSLNSTKNEISTISSNDLHREYTLNQKIFGKDLFSKGSRMLRKLSPKFLNIPTTADQYCLYEEFWFQSNGGTFSAHILNLIQKNDIVIFNAEGSTYRKNFGALVGLFILYLSSKKYNKKSFFMNGSVTITSVDNVLTEIIRKVAKYGVQFAVREPYSKRCLDKIQVESIVIPDSVFYYANIKSDNKRKKEIFSVSKSMLPMMLDSNKEVHDPFINLIINISNKTKFIPLLLSRDPEDKVLLAIKKFIPQSLICSGSNYSYMDIQKSISETQFLISGRYHHLIFGANNKIPLCFFGSTSPKIHGLAELLQGGNTQNIFDPTHIYPKIDDITNHCLRIKEERPSWDSLYMKQQFTDFIRARII